MARIRSIKPEFWKSESIALLTMQTRLTFIALWNFVDDNGVGRDVEKLLAAEIYPLEEDSKATLAHVHRSLDELSTRGRIIRYTNDGKRYFHVTGWTEHQKIDRPNRKRYPLPDDDGSKALTCTVTEIRRGLDEGSTNTRVIPSPGAGSREQGAGSREIPKALPTADASGDFAAFWAIYPRKVDKAKAQAKFKTATKKAPAATIIAALLVQLPGRTFQAPAPGAEDFRPYATSWLHNERWADEIPTVEIDPTDQWARAVRMNGPAR